MSGRMWDVNLVIEGRARLYDLRPALPHDRPAQIQIKTIQLDSRELSSCLLGLARSFHPVASQNVLRHAAKLRRSASASGKPKLLSFLYRVMCFFYFLLPSN